MNNEFKIVRTASLNAITDPKVAHSSATPPPKPSLEQKVMEAYKTNNPVLLRYPRVVTNTPETPANSPATSPAPLSPK